MLTGPYMPNLPVWALLGLSIAGTGPAVAQQACFPHCDYTHYYGPYDFSYKQPGPGLFGYPHCGPQGDCAPNLSYATGLPRPIPAGRITVRLPRLMTPRQP
jgi:hypothetical protein